MTENEKIVGYEVDGMLFCDACVDNDDVGYHVDRENSDTIYLNDAHYHFSHYRCESCGNWVVVHLDKAPASVIEEAREQRS